MGLQQAALQRLQRLAEGGVDSPGGIRRGVEGLLAQGGSQADAARAMLDGAMHRRCGPH